MKHFTVENIDYARYDNKIKFELVGGSRPRLTLVHKTTRQRFIFKSYTHNSREVWAECLASHLGVVFDIKVQQVVIKRAPKGLEAEMRRVAPALDKNWIPIGTLARNIFPRGQEIVYGSLILETPTDTLPLEVIEDKIRRQYYAPDELLSTFAQMIVFDAIIGNMDRHHENWGIVETVKYKQQLLFDKKQITSERWFTPLYDHGSSLMFELSDADIAKYLADENLFQQKYIQGKSYTFVSMPDGSPANIFTIIQHHIRHKTAWGKRFKAHIVKLNDASRLEVGKAIAKMPNTQEIDYSEARKELLLRSILYRLQLLKDMVD